MAAEKKFKVIRSLRLLVILLVVFGLVAAKKDKKKEPGAPPPAETPKSLTIQEIQATADQVTLQGTAPLQAAAFILGDPIRLMVDIKGASLGSNVPASIPVNGNPIQSVNVQALETEAQSSVRLELALVSDVVYQLKPSDNSLVITLTPRQTEAPQKAISEDIYNQAKAIEEKLYTAGSYTPPPSGIEMPPASAQAENAVQPISSPAFSPAPILEPVPPPEAGSATKVVDVLHRTSESYFQFLIKADGGVGPYNAFTLNQPNRLVIDLPGLKEASAKKTFPIQQSGVKEVRLGAHPDKTRVIIEFSGPVPAYSFSRAKQGLVVNLSLH